MLTYLFYFLTFLAVLSALMVIFSRNPVFSVLYLILTFFAIAGHYILLNAQFLAAVHIIVYAGAIMVLFLFVIMLLNLNRDTEPQHSNLVKFIGVIASGLLLITFTGAFKYAVTEGAGTLAQVYTNQAGLVKTLGKALFTDFLLPFEISTILFLAAIVGTVMLGKKELTNTEKQNAQ
jgi:NADH-quinone oxidoreductase subunit J